ncbi:polysaccharide deacetylase family protein [Streptomyces sp. NPDC053079]|uniref:polysaccharide deacetylase family protein n=1 Tax=Streptomyces sp. NPDC053079 TaxID=3365697 RepID=UPI0037D3DD5E
MIRTLSPVWSAGGHAGAVPTSNRPAFTRRWLLAASGTALVAPLLGADPASATSAGAGNGRPSGPDHHVAAGPKTLALTFTDGPNPLYTPEVLAVLARYRIRATFFMMGANVAKYPHIARQVADAGHTLSNHTWTHPNLDHLPSTFPNCCIPATGSPP